MFIRFLIVLTGFLFISVNPLRANHAETITINGYKQDFGVDSRIDIDYIDSDSVLAGPEVIAGIDWKFGSDFFIDKVEIIEAPEDTGLTPKDRVLDTSKYYIRDSVLYHELVVKRAFWSESHNGYIWVRVYGQDTSDLLSGIEKIYDDIPLRVYRVPNVDKELSLNDLVRMLNYTPISVNITSNSFLESTRFSQPLKTEFYGSGISASARQITHELLGEDADKFWITGYDEYSSREEFTEDQYILRSRERFDYETATQKTFNITIRSYNYYSGTHLDTDLTITLESADQKFDLKVGTRSGEIIGQFSSIIENNPFDQLKFSFRPSLSGRKGPALQATRLFNEYLTFTDNGELILKKDFNSEAFRRFLRVGKKFSNNRDAFPESELVSSIFVAYPNGGSSSFELTLVISK
jgi:hypothetical protein